jgi:hypothetical protein
MNRIQVSEGKLVLPDGMNYKLLVIPDRKDIPLEVVKKVEKMIADGANVLIQNPVIAQNSVGKIFRNISIDDALTKLSVAKDFSGDADKLDFTHRKTDKLNIYFIRNKTGQPIAEECEFRVISEQPEYWDPVTSQQYKIKDAKIMNGKTKLKLQLPPNGSCFIIFNSESRKLPEYNRPAGGQIAEIKSPWTLSFPEKWGAPASIKFNELISWTDHIEDGIKFFSGTASYSNNFFISKEAIAKKNPITINLGEVLDVAEIFVNGKSVGILWTSPFSINIQDYVREGKNNLEIKVTNMWINRLTGDMNLPPDKKYCKTNQPYVMKDRSPWGDETFRVQRSGLLGPVTITESPGALKE